MTLEPTVLDGEAAYEKARSLIEVIVDDVEWTVLYRDPTSGLLWKQWLPWPESHGGGPIRLELIPRSRALLEFDVTEEDLDGQA